MVFYKSKNGYYYKKEKNGKSIRISKLEYNKKPPKKTGGNPNNDYRISARSHNNPYKLKNNKVYFRKYKMSNNSNDNCKLYEEDNESIYIHEVCSNVKEYYNYPVFKMNDIVFCTNSIIIGELKFNNILHTNKFKITGFSEDTSKVYADLLYIKSDSIPVEVYDSIVTGISNKLINIPVSDMKQYRDDLIFTYDEISGINANVLNILSKNLFTLHAHGSEDIKSNYVQLNKNESVIMLCDQNMKLLLYDPKMISSPDINYLDWRTIAESNNFDSFMKKLQENINKYNTSDILRKHLKNIRAKAEEYKNNDPATFAKYVNEYNYILATSSLCIYTNSAPNLFLSFYNEQTNNRPKDRFGLYQIPIIYDVNDSTNNNQMNIPRLFHNSDNVLKNNYNLNNLAFYDKRINITSYKAFDNPNDAIKPDLQNKSTFLYLKDIIVKLREEHNNNGFTLVVFTCRDLINYPINNNVNTNSSSNLPTQSNTNSNTNTNTNSNTNSGSTIQSNTNTNTNSGSTTQSNSGINRPSRSRSGTNRSSRSRSMSPNSYHFRPSIVPSSII
jgi:hypothetical protein